MESKPKDYSCEGCGHLKKEKSVYPSLMCMLGNPINATRCEEYATPFLYDDYRIVMDRLYVTPKPGELIRLLVRNKMLT